MGAAGPGLELANKWHPDAARAGGDRGDRGNGARTSSMLGFPPCPKEFSAWPSFGLSTWRGRSEHLECCESVPVRPRWGCGWCATPSPRQAWSPCPGKAFVAGAAASLLLQWGGDSPCHYPGAGGCRDGSSTSKGPSSHGLTTQSCWGRDTVWMKFSSGTSPGSCGLAWGL